jgi:hypothetical protein
VRESCTLPAAAVYVHINVLVVTSTCITVFLYTFVKEYNKFLRSLERTSAAKDFITNCGNSRLGLKLKRDGRCGITG